MEYNALQVFERGGIVIYPTDTAIGIGCRIDNREAVDRVFRIRERPPTQAVPVLVSSYDMAKRYYDNPSYKVQELAKKYWPGGLTIVSNASNIVYERITGGSGTIGMRMPNHPGLLSVIERLGVPIVGCSANIHGEKTPYRVSDLDVKLGTLVDYVWEEDALGTGVSTVIDDMKIIRQGIVHL